MLLAGVTFAGIMQLLGHNSPEMTLAYLNSNSPRPICNASISGRLPIPGISFPTLASRSPCLRPVPTCPPCLLPSRRLSISSKCSAAPSPCPANLVSARMSSNTGRFRAVAIKISTSSPGEVRRLPVFLSRATARNSQVTCFGGASPAILWPQARRGAPLGPMKSMISMYASSRLTTSANSTPSRSHRAHRAELPSHPLLAELY